MDLISSAMWNVENFSLGDIRSQYYIYLSIYLSDQKVMSKQLHSSSVSIDKSFPHKIYKHMKVISFQVATAALTVEC